MNDIPLDFWIAVGVVITHMVLCHIVLDKVKRDNFAAFERTGSPHLFLNNTPRSTWLFWKWLWSSAPHTESGGVVSLVWTIRALTVVFFIWFVAQARLFM